MLKEIEVKLKYKLEIVAVMSTYFQNGCELDEFYGTVKFVSIPLKHARVLWDVDSSLSDVGFYDLKILDLDAPKQSYFRFDRFS